ncbi:MAG: pyridoxine 5'-phosphate synthase [Bacteroidales bacterium]
MIMKTHLSVNINKIATIRNSRGGNIPNVVEAAIRIQGFGADGITVHPRPDGRHIRVNDVYDLKKVITTEFNIEGNPTEKFIQLITDVVPEQVTLVPDAHDAITSNQGWDTVTHKAFLTDVVKEFKKYGIRVSIFVDPVIKMVEAAAETGADRIELYTEPYASAYPQNPQKAVAPYVEAANVAQRCGLGVNAGHDLNLQNLRYLKQNIPFLAEVSIGHALISDALYLGLENTVKAYKACLQES